MLRDSRVRTGATVLVATSYCDNQDTTFGGTSGYGSVCPNGD
jgi:hypothetical protein